MKQPRVYVGASTKAYFGYDRTLRWLSGIGQEIARRDWLSSSGVVPFVIPSFPALAEAVRLAAPGTLVGAQDVAAEDGPFTGDVPAVMLSELGVDWVEIGHAERRIGHSESDELIARKYRAVRAAGMVPLLCIGESARTETGAALEIVARQVEAAVPDDASGDLLLAYEPVWAIGARGAASASSVNDLTAQLRIRLRDTRPHAVPRILYGGAAGPGTLSAMDELDGVFLGRFSHDPARFGDVLDEARDRSAHAVAASRGL